MNRVFAENDAEARRLLQPGEEVLAIGRCTDITFLGGPEKGGSEGHYLMVTNRRLFWPGRLNPGFQVLELERVTGFTERYSAHRYAVALQHPSVERGPVPEEVLSEFPPDFFVGRARDPRVTSTVTELAFSKSDTKAAIALRDVIEKANDS